MNSSANTLCDVPNPQYPHARFEIGLAHQRPANAHARRRGNCANSDPVSYVARYALVRIPVKRPPAVAPILRFMIRMTLAELKTSLRLKVNRTGLRGR
jgi:hypothetical protein